MIDDKLLRNMARKYARRVYLDTSDDLYQSAQLALIENETKIAVSSEPEKLACIIAKRAMLAQYAGVVRIPPATIRDHLEKGREVPTYEGIFENSCEPVIAESHDEIVQAVIDGYSLEEIAAKYNVCTRTVRRWLEERNKKYASNN